MNAFNVIDLDLAGADAPHANAVAASRQGARPVVGRRLALTGSLCLSLLARVASAQPGPAATQVVAAPDGTVVDAPVAAQTTAPPTVDADPAQFEDGRPIAGVESHVRVWHKDTALAQKAVARALGELERVHAKLAADIRTSEVATINRAADREEVLVSAETVHLLSRAQELCRTSGGAFDASVGSYDYLWNFRRRPAVRPLDTELAARQAMVGCDKLVLKPDRIVRLMTRGTRLRLDDLAHGAAMEAAARQLRQAGIENFRIRIGADVYVAGRTGQRHWYVAVRHPENPRRDLVQLYLTSHAAATRHRAEHSFYKDGVRYHDAIDPRTGKPAGGVVLATVIGVDAAQADGLSAAVFVLGPQAGIALLDRIDRVEGFVVDTKGKVYASRGMADFARLPERIDL